MSTPQKPRPKLTLRIFAWGLLDAAGMALVAIGGAYILHGTPMFSRTFPASLAEAWVCALAGVGVMIYAVGQIFREMAKQPHLFPQAGPGAGASPREGPDR
jgi:hypothetical protein